MRYLFLVVVNVVLFSSLAHAELTLFFKDGTKEAGSSIWTENNKVYLSKSKEVYEYSSDEVKLDETLKYNKLGKYQLLTPEVRSTVPGAAASKQRRAKGGHVTQAAVRPKKRAVNAATTAIAPVVAATPVPVVAIPALQTPTPPAQPPAATPIEKENATPAAAAPTESVSPPDKAELERRKQEAVKMMTEAVMKKDPELMKKALEMQKSTLSQQGAAAPKNSVIPLGVLLAALAASLLIIVAQWIIFERAGQAGWKCLVPFYNMYVLMEISGKPGWWLFLLFIPLVGVVFLLLAMLSLAKKFSRSELFGLGIFILPMIFLPVLAFGGSEYEG